MSAIIGMLGQMAVESVKNDAMKDMSGTGGSPQGVFSQFLPSQDQQTQPQAQPAQAPQFQPLQFQMPSTDTSSAISGMNNPYQKFLIGSNTGGARFTY